MATEKRAECKEKDTRLHYERYLYLNEQIANTVPLQQKLAF